MPTASGLHPFAAMVGGLDVGRIVGLDDAACAA